MYDVAYYNKYKGQDLIDIVYMLVSASLLPLDVSYTEL